jgi:hypothetical protein
MSLSQREREREERERAEIIYFEKYVKIVVHKNQLFSTTLHICFNNLCHLDTKPMSYREIMHYILEEK